MAVSEEEKACSHRVKMYGTGALQHFECASTKNGQIVSTLDLQVFWRAPFYRGGPWGATRLRDLLKDAKLAKSATEIHTGFFGSKTRGHFSLSLVDSV